jgi:type II secretory pathway component GspD/PulD (secretin)
MRRLAIVIIVVSGLLTAADAAQSPLDARVTIDYRNAPGLDVITTLASGAGLSVQVGSGRLRPVTIALTNVKLSNALNALCDNALCLWSLDGSVLRVTPLPSEKSASLPPMVSFELHDTTATDVFRALAAAIDVPITIEPGLSSETVSFNFKNAATSEVLNILCNFQQCQWDFDPARGLRVTQKR